MKLLFKGAQLKNIFKVTAEAKKFRIPYEGEKTQKKPTLWLVQDAGIYIVPSVGGLKYPLEKENICYAQGHGPNTHHGGSDGIEDFPFDPKWIENLEKGYDFYIKLTDELMDIGFIKPKA